MAWTVRRLFPTDAAAFEKDFGFWEAAFLSHPGAVAFGAFEGETAVGLGWGFVLPRPDGERMFFLYSLDVLSAWRNRGIGTAIVKELCGFAEESGCRKVFLLTEESNPAACRVYEKAGLSAKHPDDRLYERRLNGKK